ncbi:MAG: hypothetical protein H0U10_13105 [Chloroflexia bacterium]|nr:hypothetical protein [Chloroflexia bacterium]
MVPSLLNDAADTFGPPPRSARRTPAAERAAGFSRPPARPHGATRRLLLTVGLVALFLAASLAGGFLPGTGNGAAAAPRATAQPAEAIPQATIAVQGSGFPEGASGRLVWAESGESLKAFRTNKQGRFATTVRLPNVAEGDYEIIVRVGRTTRRIAIQVRDPVGDRVALGVFQPNAPGKDALNRAAELLGREPAIVMWYQHWGFPDTKDLNLEQLRDVARRGAVPMITWEPWNPRKGLKQSKYRLDNLCTTSNANANDGQKANNDYIDTWAEELDAYKEPVLLRFAHEMNGTWYPWGAGVNGNEAGDYVDAWRCIRDRFAAAGANNVEWVWSPNVSFFGSADLEPLFPGTNEVEWLGLDGYNFGGSPGDWRSFIEVFDASLKELENLPSASELPVMIAETASSETGGSKAGWIRAAMFNNLPLAYPQVRAIVWFNQKKEQDWRFTSSPPARAAFVAAANHPYYDGSLPR